jgi:hypothetical protein
MKSLESKCQFNSKPLKVKNPPDLLVCKWYTIIAKNIYKGYNFASNLTSIEGLHKKLWASKVTESQFQDFQDSQIQSPETKWHLGVTPMARHREYYKGEGDGFP